MLVTCTKTTTLLLVCSKNFSIVVCMCGWVCDVLCTVLFVDSSVMLLSIEYSMMRVNLLNGCDITRCTAITMCVPLQLSVSLFARNFNDIVHFEIRIIKELS